MNENYELYDVNNPEHNDRNLYEVVEYEGLRSSYSCYIDGNGSPQLQPFGTEKTDEVNGVEVTFPVKNNDFRKFREEAEIVFRPFELRPEVVGNSEYSVKDFKVLISSDDNSIAEWQLVEPISTSYYNREKIRVAVQGNIEYPLNIHMIEDNLSKEATQILNENFRLHFPIGDLDIAASREELGYDKNTVQNIVDKLEVMAKEITERQNLKINELDTVYEARKYIAKIKQHSTLYNNFDFTYKGKTITNVVEIPNSYSVVKYQKKHTRYGYGRLGVISREGLNQSSWTTKFNIIVNNNDNVIWVYNDDKKKTINVTKARSLVTDSNYVYLIQDFEVIEKLGMPEYVNASEIEREVGTKSKNKVGKHFKEYCNTSYNSGQWSSTYGTAESLELDLDDEFYYVVLDRNSVSNGTNIYEYKKLAEGLGLITEDTKVFGVSTSFSKTKKFKELSTVEFTEFIKNKIKNSRKFKAELKNVKDLKTYKKINGLGGCLGSLIIEKSFCDKLEEGSLFDTVSKDFARCNEGERNDLLRLVENIAYNLDVEIPEFKYTLVREIMDKYPLISNLGYYKINYEAVLEYIKGIDLLRNSQNIANQTTTDEIQKEA